MATEKDEKHDSGEPGEALVGMFCHTFKADGRYQYQGRVLAYLGTGHYLVQLYSAWDGQATYAQIANISDMRAAGWRFYRDEKVWRSYADEMNEETAKDNYTPPGFPPTLGLS